MKCYVEENFLYTFVRQIFNSENFFFQRSREIEIFILFFQWKIFIYVFIYYTMHNNVFVITFSKFHRKRETRDPIFLYSRIHLPLMDGLSVKYVIKKLFCFSFEFNENYWNCSYLCVLIFDQVSLNLNGKQKSFLNDTFNIQSCPLRTSEFGLHHIRKKNITKIVHKYR